MSKTAAKTYEPAAIAEKIVKYCLASGKRFLFISGNGGSGKTELSKIIYKDASKLGRVNIIDMDDFVVDTKLRNTATAVWDDIEKGRQTGKYTTSLAESYFLQGIKAILYNIKNCNDYYHWPKKAMATKECRLLYGDAVLTIVEGVGTVFLDKDESDSVGIFMQCNEEIEISRRINRNKFSNEKNDGQVYENFAQRNSQYKTNVEPHISEYQIVLESLENYSLSVERDDHSIFRDL